MNLPEANPTRKQRFDAALRLAGITQNEWCADVYPGGISVQHLIEVWKFDADTSTGRKPSAELNAAIDATIEKYLGATTANS